MWHCKYFVILESIVKFAETYMKMSKYENSLFPYFLQITANLPQWKLKDTNVTLIYFLRLLTETITPERKSFFRKLNDINKIREELWRIHLNRDFSFRIFLLRYEPCIKNKDSSRCEFNSTGFSCHIAVTKPKINSTSKQTKISITSSINQIVIR